MELQTEVDKRDRWMDESMDGVKGSDSIEKIHIYS